MGCVTEADVYVYVKKFLFIFWVLWVLVRVFNFGFYFFLYKEAMYGFMYVFSRNGGHSRQRWTGNGHAHTVYLSCRIDGFAAIIIHTHADFSYVLDYYNVQGNFSLYGKNGTLFSYMVSYCIVLYCM